MTRADWADLAKACALIDAFVLIVGAVITRFV
jgi:hypothetical protein